MKRDNRARSRARHNSSLLTRCGATHLERTARLWLGANVGEVRIGCALNRGISALFLRQGAIPDEMPDHFREVRGRHDLRARHAARLLRLPRGRMTVRRSSAAWQTAESTPRTDGAQLAGEGEVAVELVQDERGGRELPRRGEDPERDRQIVAAALLR